MTPTAVASDVEVVARAIARVITLKTIEGQPNLKRLGGLERAAATTSMVNEMWPLLKDEAQAAIDACGKLA